MAGDKRVVVLAGPNGAGKTTSSRLLLPEFVGNTEFVNADVIEREIAEPDGGSRAFAAGRMMLERIRLVSERGEDLAFETTPASRTFAPLLRRLTADGYRVYLCCFWLRDHETSIERIKNRVQLGGHHVPDDVVRRRYVRGLRNFFDLYRALAHRWRVYDNSGDRPVLTNDDGRKSLDDNAAVTAAVQRAVREAIEEQCRAGLSITIWRDGERVVVPPEEIPALLASSDGPVEERPASDEGRVAPQTSVNR